MEKTSLKHISVYAGFWPDCGSDREGRFHSVSRFNDDLLRDIFAVLFVIYLFWDASSGKKRKIERVLEGAQKLNSYRVKKIKDENNK